MKQGTLTRAQKHALQLLTRKDIALIRRNPAMVSASRHLLMACRKVIKKIDALPRHAGAKKRETAFKRIVALCEKAIARAGQ
jgi:hypothetical protein